MRTLAVAVALLATGLALAQPEDLIVVQGEDFACATDAWVARDQSSRYAPDSALRHLWGARGGEGVATAPVELPAAGRWTIWVRHTVARSSTPGARAPFAFEVRRGD